MTDRRRDTTVYQQGGPGYNRVMQRIDEGLGTITERLETAFDRVDQRMARIEKDVASGAEGRDKLATDLAELRRDLGDLRDTVAMADKGKTEAAAKGAAAGATEAAGVVAAAIAHPKSRWEKMIAVAVGFTAILVAANNVPDAARGIEKVWSILTNKPTAEAPAKKDATDGE